VAAPNAIANSCGFCAQSRRPYRILEKCDAGGDFMHAAGAMGPGESAAAMPRRCDHVTPEFLQPEVPRIEEPPRSTPVIHDTDVLVLGGSCTGVFAAIRAARLGCRVAIVEKAGGFGGVATL